MFKTLYNPAGHNMKKVMNFIFASIRVNILLFCALAVQPLYAQDYLSNFMLANWAKIQHQYLNAQGYIEKLPESSFEQDAVNKVAMQIYLRLGEFDQALKYANSIVVNNPLDPQANLIIIANIINEGDFDKALGLSQSNDWLDYRQTFFQGWAYYGIGATQSSRAIWDSEAMSQFPHLGSYSSSQILASQGKYEEAVERLGDLTEYHDSVRLEALYLYLKLQMKLENEDAIEALAANENFSNTDPQAVKINNLLAYHEQGVIPYLDFDLTANKGLYDSLMVFSRLLQSNFPEDTLETQRLAAVIYSEDPLVYLETAEYLSYLESNDLALATLDQIPDSLNYALPEAIYRADILIRDDKIGEGIEVLKKTTQRFGGNDELWFKLGEFQYFDQQYVEATVSITNGLELINEDSPNYTWYPFYVRGGAFDFIEDYERMESDFRKALELDPDNDQVLNHFGYSLAVRNTQLEQAEMMIKRALEQSPKNGAYLDSLGWVYFRMGRYEDAERYLLEANLISPNEFEIIDHIGDLYWVTDRQEEARNEWQRALELDPTEKIGNMIKRKLELGLEEAERWGSSN
ncbi:MAG: tetratricopeptide repeat protein [Rhodobacteraceae bacterium]|nr:tetratricopeptide repeat protein [Paracoccaceae bacterium]